MRNLKQAVITVGGRGTRLKNITKECPKPLFPINGISTLERAVKNLSEQSIFHFILLVNYQNEKFLEASQTLQKKYDVLIDIYIEDKVMGEAGGLIEISDKLDDLFLFLNGDVIFNISLIKLWDFHQRNDSDLTLITHTTNHPEDSDSIIESPNLSINKFKFKNETSKETGFFLGNAGIVIISRKIVDFVKSKSLNAPLQAFKDFSIFGYENKFKVFSYNTSEYIKDMGTEERFKQVCKDLNDGLVEKRSYRNKQRVIFLDRDNTLIKCKKGEYINDFKHVNFFHNRIRSLKIISENYDFIALITNQPQIAMGYVSWQDVINLNGEIINKCLDFGLEISCFYLCPHHPHDGFENEISNLKTSCFCRKPLPGLVLQASFERNIDLKNSLFIGDSLKDKECSQKANVPFKWAHLLESSPQI